MAYTERKRIVVLCTQRAIKEHALYEVIPGYGDASNKENANKPTIRIKTDLL